MAQKYKYSPVIPIILRNFAVKRVIAMIVFPNAKINLGLNIVSRRPDGYHDLLTIFYPVGRYAGTPSDSGRLADIIEITPSTSDTDSMKVTGQHIDCHMHDNLVWKALQLFRKSVPDLPTVDIKLEKHLPDGAGMGFIDKCSEQFDFIFADPPYALKDLESIPARIFESGILKEDGLLVLEHGKENHFEDDPHFIERRVYGSVNFSFFRAMVPADGQ